MALTIAPLAPGHAWWRRAGIACSAGAPTASTQRPSLPDLRPLEPSMSSPGDVQTAERDTCHSVLGKVVALAGDAEELADDQLRTRLMELMVAFAELDGDRNRS